MAAAGMKIVADRYIPGIESMLGAHADVVLLEPDAIHNSNLRGCDALLVRTVTRVDAALLHDTPVRFVATATSGQDHVDTAYLAEQGIGFASAAGCNARPVAEYVLSALAVLCEQTATPLNAMSVGIIGCGHVGSQLDSLLQVLGIQTFLHDPPLAAQGDTRAFVDLDTVLQADVVTLHVPYTEAGAHPTANLIDAARLQQLGPGALLINTARGGVIDEAALWPAIGERDLRVVLDVWASEPMINTALLESVLIGTPHIAGYSRAAKQRASCRVVQALAEYYGLPVAIPANTASKGRRLTLAAASSFVEQARLAILVAYDVRTDAAALARLLCLPPGEQPGYFSALRQDYRLRDEFSSLTLTGATTQARHRFRSLGFDLNVLTTAEDDSG